jgi:hypothetical protein
MSMCNRRGVAPSLSGGGPIRRQAGAFLLLATLGTAAPAFGGDWFGRPESSEAGTVEAASRTSTLGWWSIPRRGRVALRDMAKAEDASLGRCVLVEQGDQLTYEIHATRRQGVFRREDFVLTRFSEPKAAAEARREARSLRARWQRIRDAVRPGS